jgi:hypothetical protein
MKYPHWGSPPGFWIEHRTISQSSTAPFRLSPPPTGRLKCYAGYLTPLTSFPITFVISIRYLYLNLGFGYIPVRIHAPHLRAAQHPKPLESRERPKSGSDRGQANNDGPLQRPDVPVRVDSEQRFDPVWLDGGQQCHCAVHMPANPVSPMNRILCAFFIQNSPHSSSSVSVRLMLPILRTQQQLRTPPGRQRS